MLVVHEELFTLLNYSVNNCQIRDFNKFRYDISSIKCQLFINNYPACWIIRLIIALAYGIRGTYGFISSGIIIRGRSTYDFLTTLFEWTIYKILFIYLCLWHYLTCEIYLWHFYYILQPPATYFAWTIEACISFSLAHSLYLYTNL